MTQTISVVYVPVPVELGVTVHAYHMAIVYDKGDGTTPKVIQAKPLVEFEGAGTEAQRNEVPRELNELYNPAVKGPGADRNSPFDRINASESDRPDSFNSYSSKVVITGDNLGSQWGTIQGAIGFVNDGNFAYLPLIQNSNSFAAFALQRAGLQVPDTSFFVGGTDQTSNMYVPAMEKPLLIHQNPNASSLEDVPSTTVVELDGSITILAFANDANAGGVIKVSANINNKDQATEVDTSSTDGTSTKTVFDTGTEAWSSQTSAFDAYQRLQSQRVVLDGGGQQVKDYDPNNTHPYTELDIDEDATGKITAAKPKIDGQPNNNNVDYSAVGQVLGSTLGRALAPNNQFVQIAASTVIGAVGQRLALAFSGSLLADGSNIGLNDVFANFGVSIAGAGASSVASFLVAELGTELHLNGFAGQLFNAAGGGFAGSVASQIASKMAATPGLTFDAAIAGLDFGAAATNAAYGISALLGSYLGHELVPAQTHEGAVGGQLLGAVGSAIGISAAIGQLLGGVLDFILPGVGSLVGTVLGTLIGDAFGHPAHPAAVDLIDQAGYLYGYNHSSISASDGGGYEVPDPMAAAAVAIVNAYLHAVNGVALDHSKQTMVGYITNPQLYYVNGWVPSGAYHTNLTPDDAVHAAALDVLQHTEVIGGDLLLKRARQNSPSNIPETQAGSGAPGQAQTTGAGQLVTMSADLSVAQDYENYLNNREAINALIAANTSMIGSRHGCRHAMLA